MTEEDTFNKLRRIPFPEAFVKWSTTEPWDINEKFWHKIGWTNEDFSAEWKKLFQKPHD